MSSVGLFTGISLWTTGLSNLEIQHISPASVESWRWTKRWLACEEGFVFVYLNIYRYIYLKEAKTTLLLSFSHPPVHRIDSRSFCSCFSFPWTCFHVLKYNMMAMLKTNKDEVMDSALTVNSAIHQHRCSGLGLVRHQRCRSYRAEQTRIGPGLRGHPQAPVFWRLAWTQCLHAAAPRPIPGGDPEEVRGGWREAKGEVAGASSEPPENIRCLWLVQPLLNIC